MNNGIAVHAWNNDHHVDWEAAKVRLQEQHHWMRKVLEAIHIHVMFVCGSLGRRPGDL